MDRAAKAHSSYAIVLGADESVIRELASQSRLAERGGDSLVRSADGTPKVHIPASAKQEAFEASALQAPDQGLMSRLKKGAGELFGKFTRSLAEVEMKSAALVPMTVSAVLLAAGIGMEVHGQSELLDQGLGALNAYKDMLSNTNPSSLAEHLKMGLKGELESFGGNQVVQGLVSGYVSPIVGMAAVALSRGYCHLKGWVEGQNPDPDKARERVLSDRQDQEMSGPAR